MISSFVTGKFNPSSTFALLKAVSLFVGMLAESPSVLDLSV
jgi:hypothetical protein